MRFTSAKISATERPLQRGHISRRLCEAQFVRFSLIVIVKTPPSPFTSEKSAVSEARSQRRTSGTDVQSAATPFFASTAPRIAARPSFSKNAVERQRGSLR